MLTYMEIGTCEQLCKTIYIASEGTPHPLTPLLDYSIRVPNITPTTAPGPLSSSIIGPPGSGSEKARHRSQAVVDLSIG